jgi:peptidoglycan/xylan/chitin deacetylase (PgdA/CDA1 family)
MSARDLIHPTLYRRLVLVGGRWAIRATYYTGLLHALARISRPKHRGLLILMYHSIGASPLLHPGLRVSEKNFAGQLDYLRRRYRILSLERAAAMIERGEPLPDNAVALTFDDGFRDNYESAFPLLRERGLPATIFVATEPLMKKKSLWPYRLISWFEDCRASRLEFSPGELPGMGRTVFDLTTRRGRGRAGRAVEAALWLAGLPERERLLGQVAEKLGVAPESDPFDDLPMLAWEQVREMADAGIEIGSHTTTHPALSGLSREEAMRELAESKKLLEAKLGRTVNSFAYPFGGPQHFTDESRRLVGEAGYAAACTTIRGINRENADPLALLRVGVQDDPPAIFAFKLSCVF